MDVKFNGNILVVEDNPVNQMVIKCQLKRMGLDVDIAENGQEALSIFKDPSQYDLIFMDLQMPIMGGVECTENIRVKNQEIPIIAVTANVTPVDKQNCNECGMNGFLAKPIQRDILVAELQKWLGSE